MIAKLLLKLAPKITQIVVMELAHRFKPLEKYVFEDNELDGKVQELEKRIIKLEAKKKK